jgi:hypothetical protein
MQACVLKIPPATPAIINGNRASPINLSLTQAAREMAKQLKIHMMRPSVSNVVEALIFEKAKAIGLLPEEPVAAEAAP